VWPVVVGASVVESVAGAAAAVVVGAGVEELVDGAAAAGVVGARVVEVVVGARQSGPANPLLQLHSALPTVEYEFGGQLSQAAAPSREYSPAEHS
jgi:hypothetical protein